MSFRRAKPHWYDTGAVSDPDPCTGAAAPCRSTEGKAQEEALHDMKDQELVHFSPIPGSTGHKYCGIGFKLIPVLKTTLDQALTYTIGLSSVPTQNVISGTSGAVSWRHPGPMVSDISALRTYGDKQNKPKETPTQPLSQTLRTLLPHPSEYNDGTPNLQACPVLPSGIRLT